MSYDKKHEMALAHEGASIAQSISISSQVELDHASSTVPRSTNLLGPSAPAFCPSSTPALSPLHLPGIVVIHAMIGHEFPVQDSAHSFSSSIH